MFCRNCGREVRDGELFCPACGKETANMGYIEIATAETAKPTYTEEEKSRDRRSGLGRAITGAALGFVSIFVVYLGFFFSIVMVGELIAGGEAVFAITFAIGIALAIISIVFGAKSIGTFKRHLNENRAKPIATLIIGIGSLAMGVLTAFITLILGICFLAVMLALA